MHFSKQNLAYIVYGFAIRIFSGWMSVKSCFNGDARARAGNRRLIPWVYLLEVFDHFFDSGSFSF